MAKRTTIWVAAIVAVTGLLAGLALAAGLRFYSVMTPSMGTQAPVGTLVVTRPADPYEVRDIVTYERNAFGNARGDMIQPAQIKALR